MCGIRYRPIVIISRNFFTATSVQQNQNANHFPQRKLTVVKKKFFPNTKDCEILVSRDAANVIKRFNFENRQLFGPCISQVYKKAKSIKKADKCVIYNKATLLGSSSVTKLKKQQATHKKQSKQLNDVSTLSEFSNILKFPVNDIELDVEKEADIIYEMDSLKQRLTAHCRETNFPSVTNVLQETVSSERQQILERWKAKMILEMGEEKFEQYQKDTLSAGTSLHKSISLYLSGANELELQDINAGHWQSIKTSLERITSVTLLEEHVFHPFLCYRGVVDCFAKYDKHFVVADWKTSKKPKLSLAGTYDTPLQVAAYVGALNFDQRFRFKVARGLILVAYENGNPASVHVMDSEMLQTYWNQWLHRLYLYWQKITKEENKE